MRDFADFFLDVSRSFADRKALSVYRKGWVDFTYARMAGMTAGVLLELERRGAGAGLPVAILMPSSPEYGAAFFAAAFLRSPCVLLDPRMSKDEIADNLAHSGAVLLIFDRSTEGLANAAIAAAGLSIPTLAAGVFAELSAPESVFSGRTGFRPDDLALLIYTSGTVGRPKGVMITWGNVFSNVLASAAAIDFGPDRKLLSILPMNHLFEFNPGFLLPYSRGFHVSYANTLLPPEIVDRLSSGFTDMVVIPLFLRSMMKSVIRQATRGTAGRIFFAAAMTISRIVPVKSVRRLLFRPILKKLGGLQRFTSGGAPLEIGVQRFFERLGITVLQGYGLTETSPVLTVTHPRESAKGSVGRPLPGTEIRVDERTGEIRARGPQVMRGYLKMDSLTAEAIDSEGWFRTGDVGRVGPTGDLFITGRIKEMIVLGNGKKVLPDEIELPLADSVMFKEVSVVGARETSGPLKGSEIVCAVIVPSDELAAACEPPVLKDLIEREVHARLQKLASYKRPHRVILSERELPKTSSRKNMRLKIRRMIEEGELT